jgi:hypothetical protein
VLNSNLICLIRVSHLLLLGSHSQHADKSEDLGQSVASLAADLVRGGIGEFVGRQILISHCLIVSHSTTVVIMQLDQMDVGVSKKSI